MITEHRIARPGWVSGAIVTEYYAIRESWFTGKLVTAPGLSGRHRVDWLYAVHGVAMNGEGLGLDGRYYHFAGPYSVGWVNSAGGSTTPCWNGVWTGGHPVWLDFGWRTRGGEVTYPLAAGGWSKGVGHLVGAYGGATFEPGSSLALRYYHSVAVDPRLIPRGSRIYIPAYRNVSGGWFVAQDTGGAIIGRHIDVYRPPTPRAFGKGRLLLQARVYVIPPGA